MNLDLMKLIVKDRDKYICMIIDILTFGVMFMILHLRVQRRDS